MAGGPLRVSVCGRLAIEHATILLREAPLPARQGRRLWAYPVLHRVRPVGRDDLAVALWHDDVSDAWASTLNALVSRLRRILAPVAAADPASSSAASPAATH